MQRGDHAHWGQNVLAGESSLTPSRLPSSSELLRLSIQQLLVVASGQAGVPSPSIAHKVVRCALRWVGYVYSQALPMPGAEKQLLALAWKGRMGGSDSERGKVSLISWCWSGTVFARWQVLLVTLVLMAL